MRHTTTVPVPPKIELSSPRMVSLKVTRALLSLLMLLLAFGMTACSNSSTSNSGAVSGPTIATVAGNGVAGYNGDGGAATTAELNNPFGVTVDASGFYYIADQLNYRIRQVNVLTGQINTVAGTGLCAYGGDGGPAIFALLCSPSGVALDGAGDLFIADTGNNRVRKVDASTGIISTVAGTGDASFGGDGGAATAAGLASPSGIALDARGNLYIADSLNNRIREVSAATGIITTVAGNGMTGYSGDGSAATAASIYLPGGVGLDAAGDLYIADSGNNRIRKVTAASGKITTVAGNGSPGYSGDGAPATEAKLYAPNSVTLDSSGNLYISDLRNSRIREVKASTGVITSIAGSSSVGYGGDGSPATGATLNQPAGVALDSFGNIYIADTDNQRVREIAQQ